MTKKQKDLEDLEAEFEIVAQEAKAKIEEKLAAAEKFLEEAEDISIEYGVPFRSEISRLSQRFVPLSFKEKYGALDHSIAVDLCDTWFNDQKIGWEHSAVC